MNLARLVEERAREAPGRLGLAFEDGAQLTFSELDGAASATARVLAACGVQRGMRVALYLQNSPAFVAAMFGVWKLGATLVPINVMYQREELSHALERTGARVLFTHRDRWSVASQIEGIDRVIVVGGAEDATAIDHDAVAVDTRPLGSVDVAETDEAVVLFTGGTTGRPKAVSTTHVGWLDALRNLAAANTGRSAPYPAAAPEVPPNLVVLPLFHAGGQQSLLFAYLVGRSVLLMSRFSVRRFAELVAHHGVTATTLMPTMLHDLTAHEGPLDLGSLRSVLVTGQQLDLQLRRRFEERFGIPVLQNYGSTEVGHVAGWTMADLRAGRWVPGAAGRVYPGVALEVRAPDGRALGPGEQGEVWVRTRVALDTATDAGEEGERLHVQDGWVRTGDVGHVDAEGVLFIVGRQREMIKCGGFQVWPGEVEEVLLRHAIVGEVAVVGVPDARLGEIPKAFVVPVRPLAPGEADDVARDLIAFCRGHLAHFKAIRAVAFVPALPRNDVGKVLRAALREEAPAQGTGPGVPGAWRRNSDLQ